VIAREGKEARKVHTLCTFGADSQHSAARPISLCGKGFQNKRRLHIAAQPLTAGQLRGENQPRSNQLPGRMGVFAVCDLTRLPLGTAPGSRSCPRAKRLCNAPSPQCGARGRGKRRPQLPSGSAGRKALIRVHRLASSPLRPNLNFRCTQGQTGRHSRQSSLCCITG
jgi:hypothetical protein